VSSLLNKFYKCTGLVNILSALRNIIPVIQIWHLCYDDDDDDNNSKNQCLIGYIHISGREWGKLRMCLEKISFNLGDEKELGCNRNAENNIRTNFGNRKELCACFIDWQKAFDHANWNKLTQMLKGTCINWGERSLISKLDMDQSAKLRLDQAETRRNVKSRRGVRQEQYLSLILFNL
jgi:Reverse transcriptase (RNA-dependent DNA polymerase).